MSVDQPASDHHHAQVPLLPGPRIGIWRAGGGSRMKLRVETITVGWLEENCHLLEDLETGEMAVVDPGDEADLILARLGERVKRVRYVLQSHGHADHTGAAAAVAEATGAVVAIGAEDAPMLELPWDLVGEPRRTVRAGLFLRGGEALPFGGGVIEVLATPGHTPGGRCFLVGGGLFSGDTLFAGSVGRTDLPGGETAALRRSLAGLAGLPEETTVYPGHGENTGIGREKRENPYLRPADGEGWPS